MAFRFEQVIDVGQPELFEDGARHELRMTVRTDLEFKDVSATSGVSMTLDLYSHLFPAKRERTRAVIDHALTQHSDGNIRQMFARGRVVRRRSS